MKLLRDALRRHLLRLPAQHEIDIWLERSLSEAEHGIAAIADWGPAEIWSDWADAAP